MVDLSRSTALLIVRTIVLLADDVVEGLRAVAAVEGLLGHQRPV